jgi:hypothetical protein
MNLRSSLHETIGLLDTHPEIETKKFAPALTKALQTFTEKFKASLKAKEGDKRWEKLRGELLKLSPEELGAELRDMNEVALMELCRFFGAKSINATKKLSARQNAEARVIKKIKEIGKQLH